MADVIGVSQRSPTNETGVLGYKAQMRTLQLARLAWNQYRKIRLWLSRSQRISILREHEPSGSRIVEVGARARCDG